MKRSLITLAVIAATTAPLVAQAAPKVYGRLNISAEDYKLDYENATKTDLKTNQLSSNASRFGMKGEDELTPSTSLVYQAEWELNGNLAGTNEQLKGRNRFVGLKHTDFGTVKFGAYDSYLKLAQKETDFFNDLAGDFKFVLAGENRLENVIGYESPVFSKVQIKLLTQTQSSTQATPGVTTTPKNGVSGSVAYEDEELGLYVAAAFDNNITSATALFGARESDNLRLVAAYKVNDLTVNGVYSSSKASDSSITTQDESAFNFGAAYKLGDETIKVSLGQAKADNAAATLQKHTLLNVGVDHNFTSKTRAFAYYTNLKEDALAPNADTTKSYLGVGIDHAF